MQKGTADYADETQIFDTNFTNLRKLNYATVFTIHLSHPKSTVDLGIIPLITLSALNDLNCRMVILGLIDRLWVNSSSDDKAREVLPSLRDLRRNGAVTRR
jgi:hypothetical protein